MNLTPDTLYDLARSACWNVRNVSPMERDDVIQSAVEGMLKNIHHVDQTRPEADQRGYLRKAGWSAAMKYLGWRSKTRQREIVSGGCALESTQDPTQLAVDETSPESWLDAAQTNVAIRQTIAVAYQTLSPQERRLLRHKLLGEPMSDDLLQLGKGPRGSVSNRARKKILTAAFNLGHEEVVTADLLLNLFGDQRAI